MRAWYYMQIQRRGEGKSKSKSEQNAISVRKMEQKAKHRVVMKCIDVSKVCTRDYELCYRKAFSKYSRTQKVKDVARSIIAGKGHKKFPRGKMPTNWRRGLAGAFSRRLNVYSIGWQKPRIWSSKRSGLHSTPRFRKSVVIFLWNSRSLFY